MPLQLSERRSTLLFWSFILSTLVILYGPLILNDPVLRMDDDQLLQPLEKLTSLGSYVEAIQRGQIFDLQPVRDLSLWLDFAAQKILPFASFHFTNVMIWILALMSLSRIALKLGLSSRTVMTLTALSSVHPVFMNSVAWIAARKHLLSMLFTLWATELIVRTAKANPVKPLTQLTVGGAVLAYGLACFSQPINVLWPIFAIVYLIVHDVPGVRFTQSKTVPASRSGFGLLCVGLLCIGLLCIGLNYHYYTGIYLAHSGDLGKFLPSEQDTLGTKLLVLGRNFFQIICPLWPCITSPSAGNIKNLIGLTLLPCFGLLFKQIWKRSRPREPFSWILYGCLPLLPVLLKLTHQLTSDTYLLNVGIGLLLAGAILLDPFRVPSGAAPPVERARKHLSWGVISGGISISVFCLLFGKSFELSRNWESNLKIFRYAYLNEATPYNAVQYGFSLLDLDQPKPAFELAQQVLNWNPSQPDLPLLLARSIFEYPNWSLEQKIKTMEDHPMNSPWFAYVLATLYSQQKDFKKAHLTMQPLLSNLRHSILKLASTLENAAADSYAFCIRANDRDCFKLVTSMQNELILHPEFRQTPWQSQSFALRLKQQGVEWIP
jgi:hypothetical protein